MLRGTIQVVLFVTIFCVSAYGATGIGVSASGPLDTVPPTFTGFDVTSSEASAGQVVGIRFTASESLSSPPSVVLLGTAQATFVSAIGLDYTYTYTVLDTDPLGMTGVSISGTDLVGNAGELSAANALEIVLPSQHVPLRSWPIALAMVLAGVVVLVRRRGVSLLMLLALLVAPMAMAGPSVTNVTFLQQSDGVGDTEVRVTYDLVSSSGPCDITVSLSKDGGTDGYPYPVSSVTGDVSAVSAGTGRVITWKIAQDYPNENIANARLRLLADDGVPAGNGLPVEMLSVAAGSFDMGRTSSGDDATYGGSDELPVHTVTLSAYEIGKYEVTNQQFCEVLNYAIDSSRNYLLDGSGAVWSGTGDIHAGADIELILTFAAPDCNIQFSAGSFSPKTRVGLPGTTNYSTATHPVVHVSWAGAAYFCNWLSAMEGLTPVYDPTSAWAANFANNGYRLPTEAQWERAAAWDGTKHWIYGFVSDTLTGYLSANAVDNSTQYSNPLGFTIFPLTSPVGWFDGVQVSPNSNVTTSHSVSPVGCYDMTGNAWEWCHDSYLSTYYATSPGTDPQGPVSSIRRVFRGGSFSDSPGYARTATRNSGWLTYASSGVGFRLAK